MVINDQILLVKVNNVMCSVIQLNKKNKEEVKFKQIGRRLHRHTFPKSTLMDGVHGLFKRMNRLDGMVEIATAKNTCKLVYSFVHMFAAVLYLIQQSTYVDRRKELRRLPPHMICFWFCLNIS